jgi:hypothetical protein
MKPKLSTIEWSQLWDDVAADIFDVGLESLDLSTNEKKRVREQSGNHGGNNKQCIGGLLSECKSDDEEEDANDTIKERTNEVLDQVKLYKKAKGIDIIDIEGGYTCPFSWWEEIHGKYHYVWALAQRVLHSPATSAPSELVFSTIAGIIDKHRARMTGENANLLLFLKENQEYIEWE